MAQASLQSVKRPVRFPAAAPAAATPLAIEAVFCPADVADPFDTVEWDLRTAAIKGEAGEVLFEQTNAKFRPPGANWRPTWWSANTSMAKSTRPNAKPAFAS